MLKIENCTKRGTGERSRRKLEKLSQKRGRCGLFDKPLNFFRGNFGRPTSACLLPNPTPRDVRDVSCCSLPLFVIFLPFLPTNHFIPFSSLAITLLGAGCIQINLKRSLSFQRHSPPTRERSRSVLKNQINPQSCNCFYSGNDRDHVIHSRRRFPIKSKGERIAQKSRS